MRLQRLVEASAAVAATRSRLAKRAALAEVLREAAESEDGIAPESPSHLGLVVAYLSGSPRQRRTGVGWRSMARLPAPADAPSLTVTDVDAALETMSLASGKGSAGVRANLVENLFSAATNQEQAFLRSLILGELRQGALDSLVLDAVAEAFEVPAAAVRRAAFLGGSSPEVAQAAAQQWRGADPEALASIGLQVGRAVRPMLASSAPDVPTAWSGLATDAQPVAVDAKLDGIRVQVHRDGDEVTVFTRSLDDVTARLPQVVDAARALASSRFVVDGEALVMDADGRPAPFQVSASRTSRHRVGDHPEPEDADALRLFLFDVLHLDGEDVVDEPAHERFTHLERLTREAPHLLVDRVVTRDEDQAQEFAARVLAAGHEGVVLKRLDAPYAAGRRGASWVKVKPRHTLDLVVLAVEWGSGRRRGTLSNIHLGARAEDGEGFVMVGKTFKGMTDEMLAWQTTRFLELETGRDGHVVTVAPEQVVEIALDGIQNSTRYPGGVALRFARVLRYREDKSASEADTIGHVRALSAWHSP